MSAVRVTCHACVWAHDFDGPVPRRAECESCGADLRCCRNCGFFDKTTYNECSEPSAERVLDKKRSNFCDYFAGAAAVAGKTGVGDGDGDAKTELDKLFKN